MSYAAWVSRLLAGLVVAGALAALVGCSTTSDSSDSGTYPYEAAGGPGAACSRPDDCAPPTLCAWPIDGGCNAQGHCVTDDYHCLDDGGVTVCGCDGFPVTLNCIYGAGHAPQPVPTTLAACVFPDASSD